MKNAPCAGVNRGTSSFRLCVHLNKTKINIITMSTDTVKIEVGDGIIEPALNEGETICSEDGPSNARVAQDVNEEQGEPSTVTATVTPISSTAPAPATSNGAFPPCS
jgi:hypothetical protein